MNLFLFEFFCVAERNRLELLNLSAVDPLLQHLRSTDKAIRAHAALCISSLSTHCKIFYGLYCGEGMERDGDVGGLCCNERLRKEENRWTVRMTDRLNLWTDTETDIIYGHTD